MEPLKKVNLAEGIPLNATSSTNIILNTGRQKMNTASAAVIQLKSSENNGPHDVGLHINTTLSIASSKKVKLLFILNFLLSLVCIVISCSLAFHYFSEMTSMRRQLEVIKDQLTSHSLQSRLAKSLETVEAPLKPQGLMWPKFEQAERQNPPEKRYSVEDVNFRNSKSDEDFTNRNKESELSNDAPDFVKQGAVIAHFVGGGLDRHLGEDPYVGPWTADYNSSSKDFARRLELTENKFVNVHEGGLYLIYAQLVYVSNTPNSFTLWATNERLREPSRPFTICASGDVISKRSMRNSLISCSVQTVVKLTSGDVVSFSQKERNSTVKLRPGYSYFGFVKLSS